MLFQDVPNILACYYLHLKAAHIVSFTAWMAGLFYLPRLFVYHVKVTPDSEAANLFKIMERRLLRAITTPAMIATYVFGLSLSSIPDVIAWKAGWWHIKLLCVLLLSGFHGFLAQQTKRFANNHYDYSEKFYRIINEIPTLLLIIIVCAVIFRW